METAVIIAIAFAIGGVLKGATGFGAPIIAVPLLAIYFDTPFAVTIFSIPNLLPNVWQFWGYRKHSHSRQFTALFALSGAVGAGVGTFLLANVNADTLALVLAFIILAYIGFRLFHPSWALAHKTGLRLCFPIGVVAGTLQGSAGLSAPVSITFLSFLNLEREQFIVTISAFFVALGLVQIPMLVGYGMLNSETAALSALALIPLMGAMPVGRRLGQRLSKERFNQIVLVLLSILGAKLFWDSFTS